MKRIIRYISPVDLMKRIIGYLSLRKEGILDPLTLISGN